jgi:hypothetical protein
MGNKTAKNLRESNMVQVYLLLVVLNLLAGLVLARGGLKVARPAWDSFFTALDSKLARGILGAATFLSGFVGLIFVLPGDQLFVGDLFPSLTALLSGTILVLDFYQKEPPPPENDDVLVKNRVLIGLVALTFGLIHFFVPGILLL